MATSSKKIQLSYPTISVSAPIFVKEDKTSMFSSPDHYEVKIGNSSLEFPTKKEADAIYNEIKNFKNEKQYLEFFQSYLLRRMPQRAFITSTFKETRENFSEPKLGQNLTIENFYKVKRGTYFKFEHDNFGKKRMTEFVFDSTINDRVLGWMKIGDNWQYGDSLYNYENKICAFSGAEILIVQEMISPPNKFELPNLNEAPKLSKKTEDDLYKLWDFVKNRKKKSDKLLEMEQQYEEIKPFLSKLTIDNVPTKIQALVLIDAKANRTKKVVSKEQVEKTIQNIWNDYYSGKDTFAYGGAMAKSYDYGGDFESPRIYIVNLEAYNNNIDEGVWLDFSDYKNADELMNDIQNWLDEWGVEEYQIIDGEYLPASMGMDVSDLRKANFEEIYTLMDVAKEKGISIDDAYEEMYGENDSYANGGGISENEVDRFKKAMNDKVIATYKVSLKHYKLNYELIYYFRIKIKDNKNGCFLTPYEYFTMKNGMGYDINNVINRDNELVPNNFDTIPLNKTKTKQLVDKLIQGDTKGVEKFLNLNFFTQNDNFDFKVDDFRYELKRYFEKTLYNNIQKIDFTINSQFDDKQNYAKGGTLNWQKYPTKNVRGLYEIKGDGINRKVNIVFFERYDDELYSLYPLDKDKHLFREIMVKSTALNSLDKGVSVQGETNDGKKVSIKRLSNQDFSYAKGGGLNRSLIEGTSGRWVANLPHAKYKITKEVTNAQVSGKNNVTYTNIVLPKGSIVHNLSGGVFVENEKLKKEFPTIYNLKYGLRIYKMEETLNEIYNNSEILEYEKGGSLIGNQKRIDLNKNGKIDAEDFKLLRTTMNGAWRNDHQHVNSTSRKDGKLQDYEVIYARKNKSDRTGYKGKTNFADGGGIDSFSEYSNDALYDMMINLARYQNTESDIERVKSILEKRKAKNLVNEEEVTYFLNKDGIKVRSKVEPKVKLSEAEWMAKHSESKEARGYAKGGAVYNKSKYLTKEQWEKWYDYVKTGKINGKKEDNMFAVARNIGTSVAKINAYEIEQRKKSNAFANGGGVDDNKYLTIYKDELFSEKSEFDNYSDALADYNYFASDDANISLYEIINGEKKLLKKNVSSANIQYVELSNGNIVVTLEKIDGKWQEGEVLEGETPYGWGGKRYMSYLKPKDLAQWLSKDYGGNFQIVEQYVNGGGFEKLSNRVARNYEGKRVKPQYQKEYGKVYSKDEAKEVGDKVAGKVKANQKMATGGKVGKIKVGDFLTLKRDVLIAYDHSEKSEKIHKGDKLEVVSISPNNPEFLRLKKENVSNNIGLRVSDFEKYELGGKTTSGGETKKGARGGIMTLAKKIRKDGEKWTDAVKRAGQQLK